MFISPCGAGEAHAALSENRPENSRAEPLEGASPFRKPKAAMQKFIDGSMRAVQRWAGMGFSA
jgi:hypothetical protein